MVESQLSNFFKSYFPSLHISGNFFPTKSQLHVGRYVALARAIWDAKVVKERERVSGGEKTLPIYILAWAKDYEGNGCCKKCQ